MINNITLELCTGSIDDCLAWIDSPIDRFELNCALESDGLTPSFSTFTYLRACTDKPLLCMIRPRTAGFLYTDNEYDVMRLDARQMLENGADGIVFGFLDGDDRIDRKRTEEMAALAHRYGAEAVFHKAFDLVKEPFSACEELISCGIDRVLTSGTADTAMNGKETLRLLQNMYGDRITILPGGGISADNAREIIRYTGVSQIHFGVKKEVYDHGIFYRTDPAKAEALLESLQSL